ncbi:Kelch repeat-containing protein [Plantactinospora siamensis]|uniref:Kelch repeat-containing protein n=1 Tax=Plantactinospora siamensis TaxID=555372 RepID=A0ABV6P2V3_9ACTN
MTTATPTATGAWTPAGDLAPTATWDGQHDGAVLLATGAVLVAGGADATSAPLARAAVFDPATGQWTVTGALHTPRRLHTVTALADGRVLAAGGTSAGAQFPAPALAGAEIYDPASKAWTAAAAMHTARWGHSAARLPDGTVLVAGGTAVRSAQSLGALRSAERFDPATGAWTETAPMTDARTGHLSLVLGNGQVLVVGGSVPTGHGDEAALAFCELYDPAADRWTPTGSLLVPRSRHQAVLLSPTSVLVTGGSPPGPADDASFDPFSRATAELYDQATGVWSAAAPMPSGRNRHRAVPLGGGRALVIGGADGIRDGVGFAGALLYDGDHWAPAGGLGVGRWGCAATALADGRVLATGGVTRSGQATAGGAGVELTGTTEIFTLAVVP